MNDIQPQQPQQIPHLQMEEVHLQDYLNVIYRRRKTFLLAFLAVFLGVAFYTFTMKPVYQASATLHVKDEKAKSELLDALALWARGRGAQWLWLEVRASNLRAQQVYEAHGFRRVGERKRYYPAGHGQREDAVVMSLPL